MISTEVPLALSREQVRQMFTAPVGVHPGADKVLPLEQALRTPNIVAYASRHRLLERGELRVKASLAVLLLADDPALSQVRLVA